MLALGQPAWPGGRRPQSPWGTKLLAKNHIQDTEQGRWSTSGLMDLTNACTCPFWPGTILFLNKFIRDCLILIFRESLISPRQWGGAGSQCRLLLTCLSWKKVLEKGASLLELSGDIISFDKKRNLLQLLPSPIRGQIYDLSRKHLIRWT